MKEQPCRIDRIRLYWGEMPVKVTFSYGAVDRFPFLIVALASGDDEGLGEALVPPNDFLLGLLPSLLGRDARRLDTLLEPAACDHDRILCEAVSMALHDLVGRRSGLALHTLLGGAADLRVPLMPCIFPANPAQAKRQAAAFFEQGFRSLKTKLTGVLEEDRARVLAVRGVAPAGVYLQGDANEGYHTLPAAVRAVDELSAAGLDMFEDPLRGGVDDYRRLCELVRDGRSKVMVDALARRTEDLVNALRTGAAQAVCIHPDQPGTMSRVLRHARLAQDFNVPVVIGGTGYTGIGSIAYMHLAAVATPGGPCGEIGGFVDHGMPCSLVNGAPPIKNGSVLLSEAPGLGIRLDGDALMRFEAGRREWEASS